MGFEEAFKNLEAQKRRAIEKVSNKLEDYERIIELMRPNIDILRKRNGMQLIKVECAINNIIEYYDELNRED